MANFQDLIVYLETETQVEDTVEVSLIRSGQELKVSVTLAERPQQP
jgi:S1-C subfamily serine protease